MILYETYIGISKKRNVSSMIKKNCIQFIKKYINNNILPIKHSVEMKKIFKIVEN